VLALLLHAVLVYRPFFEDDAFISLRYAKRLVGGKGLTYSGGDRVEGYTNFLWVILIAAGSAISRADPLDVARALGLSSAGAAIVGVFYGNLPRLKKEVWPLFAVGLGLALSTPVATWAMGGLEEPLLAALAVWGIVLGYRAVESDGADFSELWPASLCWAFAAITRADGILFAAAGSIGLVLARGLRRRAWMDAAKLAAVPLGFVLLHMTFRRAYYHAWVPNTYHAKVSLGWNRVEDGWGYLTRNTPPVEAIAALKVFTIAAAVLDPIRRRRIVFTAAALILWTAYVVVIGGDMMPAQRHLVPLFFLAALLDAEGLVWLCRQSRAGAVLAQIAAFDFVVQVGRAAFLDKDRALVCSEKWEWAGRPVGLFLNRAFASRKPLLAVDAAGATPYFAELDTLDMLGLNDRYLAQHPPKNMGTGLLAHELGDGSYVLRRKPDLVIFHVPPGQANPVWRGGREMTASPEFRRLYALVRFNTRGPDDEQAIVWVRQEDGRVGIERGRDLVTVPGFLLAASSSASAEFDESGRLGALIAAGQTLALSPLALEPGTWRGTIDADGVATLIVAADLDSPAITEGGAIRFTVSRAFARIAVAVRADPSNAVHVRSLEFTRER
jgi:arabinofuranosyltransferase